MLDDRSVLVSSSFVKKALIFPDENSHKGQNGKILIIANSPLFHGAGRLSALALYETITLFASKTNDMVYFCSTKENINYLKQKQETFKGVLREAVDSYIKNADVILAGPGLMREEEKNRPDTKGEVLQTQSLTKKVLESDKKLVLDAGSLQVINSSDLLHNQALIITPHRSELANLFKIDPGDLITSHKSDFEEIKKVAELIQELAKKYQITILLKGPVDIIANKNSWFYVRGGNGGMTKGGTGDVLAGGAAAIYSRTDDPVLAASAASFILKKTADDLWKESLWLYSATDLVNSIVQTTKKILSS